MGHGKLDVQISDFRSEMFRFSQEIRTLFRFEKICTYFWTLPYRVKEFDIGDVGNVGKNHKYLCSVEY